MAALEPKASDEAPPSVAAPPTISNTGRAYLISPDVSALFSATVRTPAPSRVVDGLGVLEGDTPPPDGLGLVLGLGLGLDFGCRLLPFWARTRVAAFRACALSLAGSGR